MLGKNLRRLRKNKLLTMKELADKSGTAPSYISDLENEVIKKPSVEKLIKIAAALGVSMNELLGANVLANNISTKIISAQTISNVSNEELSKKTGITEEQLIGIKTKLIKPTKEQLNKIAIALNFSLSYFLNDSSVNIDTNGKINDNHNPVELQIKFGIDKDEMTREELYSLIYFYQNKISIAEKKELVVNRKLESIIDFINNK